MFRVRRVAITSLSLLSLVLLLNNKGGAQAQTCDFNKDIDVCFQNPPLKFDRCKRRVLAEVKVIQSPVASGRKYRLKWQWYRNDKPITDATLVQTSGDGFALSEALPYDMDKVSVNLDPESKKADDYAIEITAEDDSGSSSGPKRSSDPPGLPFKYVRNVNAVVIGTSVYENSVEKRGD